METWARLSWIEAGPGIRAWSMSSSSGVPTAGSHWRGAPTVGWKMEKPYMVGMGGGRSGVVDALVVVRVAVEVGGDVVTGLGQAWISRGRARNRLGQMMRGIETQCWYYHWRWFRCEM